MSDTQGQEMREQFTFYASFFHSIDRIKKKADRADAYDAICKYALSGIDPDLDKMADSAAIAFIGAKPNLDASRRKAANGKKGGSAKQTGSKKEANRKQSESEKEIEVEKENENEIENECYIRTGAQEQPLAPGSAFTAFWSAYPTTRGGREAAYQAWKELAVDVITAKQIMDALETFKRCAAWRKDDGQYIPGAVKFLAERQWEKPPVITRERELDADERAAIGRMRGKKDVPMGSGVLGEAELEAIRQVLREDAEQ